MREVSNLGPVVLGSQQLHAPRFLKKPVLVMVARSAQPKRMIAHGPIGEKTKLAVFSLRVRGFEPWTCRFGEPAASRTTFCEETTPRDGRTSSTTKKDDRTWANW